MRLTVVTNFGSVKQNESARNKVSPMYLHPLKCAVVSDSTTPVYEHRTAADLSGVGIVVPTYNAEAYWPELCASLKRQGVAPANILIIDSSSTDHTYALACESGFRTVSISKEEFGHGRTRQAACDLLPHLDMLVYLTQDACLQEGNSVSLLCAALSDPHVGAAYGRQAPRPDANPIERHARLFNYPDRSHVMTFEGRKTYGIRAAFCSNSFAVYRRSALLAVGGFPADVILAEDSVVAARLLMAGWQVVYQADAVAVHSHPLRLRQEFARYFDTGAHHSREQWLLQTFGSAASEGLSFVMSELGFLRQHAPMLIPLGLIRTCNKLLAYRLGRLQHRLPYALRVKLSAHPSFWTGQQRQLQVDPPESIATEWPVRSDAATPMAAVVSGRTIDSSASM